MNRRPRGFKLLAIVIAHDFYRKRLPHGQRANLQGVDLQGVDLRWVNLEWADLRWANLKGANFRGANLRSANLEATNLQGVDFRWANLHGAGLRDTDIRDANFRGANIKHVLWPSPGMVLLADWGNLSDDLTKLGMALNRDNHSDPERFLMWANGSPYQPYPHEVDKIFNFQEKKELYDHDLPSLSVYQTMKMVLEECCEIS